jgi:hypothetical protein
MTGPVIKTPRGQIIQTKNGKAELSWNTNFQSKWQKRYSNAQKFIDSEVLRLSEPFTPLRTSMLIKSGTLGTYVGSGVVQWIAPYARRQYYMKNRKRPSNGEPLRGSFWFHRMKALYRRKIVEGAAKIAGGEK